MKEKFLKAIAVTHKNFLFVILLSIGGFLYANNIFSILLTFFILIIIAPGIFGYLTETLRYGKNKTPFSQNVKKYIIKMLCVSIIIGIPVFIYSMVPNVMLNPLLNATIKEILIALIGALTLYVIPIVFLKEIIYEAIPLGINFLFKHLQYSLPLLLLSFLLGITKMLYIFIFTHISNLNLLAIISIGYIFGLIGAYIGIIQFIVATMVLLDKNIAEKINYKNT